MKNSAKRMRRNGPVLAALMCLFFASGSVWGAAPYFTPQVLSSAESRLAPAIGLLDFSVELMNESSGETTRRETSALALVVSPDGLVMTHGHMVRENATPFNITVTLGLGGEEQKYDAVLLDKPEDVNVVFLRLQSEKPLDLPYVRFDREDRLALGDPVTVFGLLGDTFDYACALQESRVGAVLEKPRRTYCLEDVLRFSFVGGPVIDAEGRVAGVAGYDLSDAEGGDLHTRSGHPLIYQTELFQRYIDAPPGETESDDEAGDAWLGVFTQPLKDDFARYWGLPEDGGLIVSTVVEGSPAAAAGLKSGDVITEFDGTPIRAKADRDVFAFTRLVRETGPEKEVRVSFLREGKPEEAAVVLGVRPTSSRDAQEYEDKRLGLTVRELTTDLRIRLNLAEDVQGVIVRSVRPGGPAHLARVRPGVIILAVGDIPAGSVEEYEAAVEEAAKTQPKEVALFARVGAATGFFRLEPRWNDEP